MPNEKINEIEYCISIGKYHQALELLNSIEKEKSLSNEEYLSKQYVEIFILLDKGEFQEGCDLADEMIKNCKMQKNSLREIDAIIAKTENSNCLGLFEESLKLIEEAELILKNLKNASPIIRKQKQAYLIYLKGRIYQDSHNVFDSIKLFKKSYELRKEIKDKFGIMWSLLNWASIITAIGNFKSAERYFNESLAIAEELNVEVGIIWNLVYLGWLKYHLRELTTAISYAEKCLVICEPKNYKYSSTRCYDLIGHCYLIKGDVNKALTFFEKSLELRIEIGYKSYIAQSYFSIGKVYSQKGELKKSLSYFKKVLESSNKDDRQMSKPTYLSAVGKIYGELGDFETAKKYLLEALDLLKNKQMYLFQFLNYNVSITTTLHYLIVLSINNNDHENIHEYLNMLKYLSQKYPKIILIKQIYKLDKAIILKASNRLMDKMEAGAIFKEIIDEKISDYEFLIETMTNFYDTLMYELELTGDTKVLNQIEELSDKMLIIAETQELYAFLAETYFIKAKILLLRLDINTARLMLTKAQNIANEHGLKRLASKISSEHDSLLAHLDEWEEKIRLNTPLSERVTGSKDEFLFSKMIRTKIAELPKESENPVYLVILNPFDGRCIYNKAFQDISIADGNLISSFISAINIFGKTAFSSSGSIDRIRHGDYLIVLQPKDDLLYGYVFKGQSYSAIAKLDKFIKFLTKKRKFVENLTTSLKNYTEISDQTFSKINELVNEIFLIQKDRE